MHTAICAAQHIVDRLPYNAVFLVVHFVYFTDNNM